MMETHGMSHIKINLIEEKKAQLWLVQTKKEDVVRVE